MSFRGWTGEALRALLTSEGFRIPPGTTDTELREFATEIYTQQHRQHQVYPDDDEDDQENIPVVHAFPEAEQEEPNQNEVYMEEVSEAQQYDDPDIEDHSYLNHRSQHFSLSRNDRLVYPEEQFEQQEQELESNGGFNHFSFDSNHPNHYVREEHIENYHVDEDAVTEAPVVEDVAEDTLPTVVLSNENNAETQKTIIPENHKSHPKHRRLRPNENQVMQRAGTTGGATEYPGWALPDDFERQINDRDDEARYDLEFGEVQPDNFSKPSKLAALEYRNLHHPRTIDGKPYSVCSAKMGRHCFATGPIGVGFDWCNEGAVSEMAKYGEGLSLHFKNLKFIFWIFLFSTLISLPQFILNSQNQSNGGGLLVTTIGNLFVYSNSSFVFFCPSDSPNNASISYLCTYSLEQLANIYVFTDLGVCILYTVALLWLHFFVNRESSQVARLFLSLDRYSIWIPRLPPGCGEIPLAQYFEELTGENVDEVNIAFDDGQLISLFIERGEILSELWRVTGRAVLTFETPVKSTALRNEEEILSIKAERLERIVDYYDLLLSTYHSLNEQTRGFNKKGNRAVSGIVTFEKRAGATKALAMLGVGRRRNKCIHFFCSHLCRCCWKTEEDDEQEGVPTFQGTILKCEVAPPPSTILWENLEYGRCAQLSRQLVASLIVCIAICASFGASIGAVLYRSELQSSDVASCNATLLYAPSISECECAAYSFAKASSAIFSSGDPCHSFWAARSPIFILTLFTTAVVSLVNFIVGYITISLSQFERHHSLVNMDLSICVRLFVAYVINTACVYIIVNVLLVTPPITDLTSNWYEQVGTQIILNMVLNIVAPHISVLYELTVSWMLKTFGDPPLMQREMNERYVGDNFPIAVRSAQIYMQAFVCFVFGAGMPLLYPISCISSILFFYVDKWSVLRFYRTPPEYDSQMSEFLVVILWLGLFGHLCFAIWTYSVPGLFWDGTNLDYPSIFVNVLIFNLHLLITD